VKPEIRCDDCHLLGRCVSRVPLLAVTDRYKPLRTVTNRYGPLQTVTDRYKPLQTVTDFPLRTVTNRYGPLQTVTNRYKPLRFFKKNNGYFCPTVWSRNSGHNFLNYQRLLLSHRLEQKKK